jgi:salicylate hydroxylase
MESNKKIEVAVIGGGIGGLCVAIGLLKHKHLNVNIYEAAHKFAEIGAGVALGPNSQRAMRLIDENIYAGFLAQATNNLWESQRSTWFQIRVGTEGRGEELITAPTNETGQKTVHRALFLDELVKLVPKEIAHFGKRVDQILDNGDEGVTLHFKDGTTATVDCIIGADGVHSPTRRFILGPDHPATNPQFTHTVAYRGLVPMERAKEVIKTEYAENSIIWTNKDEVIMTYPINFGAIMNVVAVRAGVEKWEHEQWTVPASSTDLDGDFAGLSESPAGVISLLKEQSISCWSMWDMLEPAPYYNKRNICVMGDGAHASTPYQGQGAGQAVEDALVLVELFGQVSNTKQIASAFKAYSQVRVPRTQRVVATSRETGDIGTYRNTLVGDDIPKLREAYETRMDWMWNKDLVAQNQEALDLMKKFLES